MSPPQFVMSLHCSKLQHKYSYLLWIQIALHCETHGFIHPEVIIVGSMISEIPPRSRPRLRNPRVSEKFTSVTKFTNS